MAHTILASTVKALRQRHFTTLRFAAVGMGFEESFAPTLGRVLSDPPGPVSLENKNRIRIALHLEPRRRPRYLRPCLSLDPATRLAQLARLTAAAQDEIELGW